MLRRTVPRPDADIRPDAEIVDDALKVLPPRAGEHEKRRKLFKKCMERMRIIKRLYDVEVPSPAEKKEEQRSHFERLQAARADLVATEASKELVEKYDNHLRVVETDLCRAVRDPKTGRYLTVPPGQHQANMVASCAAAMARDLFLEAGQRMRRKQWHRLSALLYEAATGEYGVNLSKYMDMCKSGQIVRSRPAGQYFT